MKHTQEEIINALKVIKDECDSHNCGNGCDDSCKESFEYVSECTGCIDLGRNRENMSGSQGCDLCRSGKQIIVYGVDYALDTKSEYHRIEPKYCPVCGRKLEGKR